MVHDKFNDSVQIFRVQGNILCFQGLLLSCFIDQGTFTLDDIIHVKNKLILFAKEIL